MGGNLGFPQLRLVSSPNGEFKNETAVILVDLQQEVRVERHSSISSASFYFRSKLLGIYASEEICDCFVEVNMVGFG